MAARWATRITLDAGRPAISNDKQLVSVVIELTQLLGLVIPPTELSNCVSVLVLVPQHPTVARRLRIITRGILILLVWQRAELIVPRLLQTIRTSDPPCTIVSGNASLRDHRCQPRSWSRMGSPTLPDCSKYHYRRRAHDITYPIFTRILGGSTLSIHHPYPPMRRWRFILDRKLWQFHQISIGYRRCR